MTNEVKSFVNCKSCGAQIDVTADPENWPLQCNDCKDAKAKLPKGYDDLKGSKHDDSSRRF